MKMANIGVLYEHKHGQHIFTSDDLRELLVVSEDFETAYEDVAESIKAILKLKNGIDCEVLPMQVLADFVQNEDSRQNHKPFSGFDSPSFAGRQFAVSACV